MIELPQAKLTFRPSGVHVGGGAASQARSFPITRRPWRPVRVHAVQRAADAVDDGPESRPDRLVPAAGTIAAHASNQATVMSQDREIGVEEALVDR